MDSMDLGDVACSLADLDLVSSRAKAEGRYTGSLASKLLYHVLVYIVILTFNPGSRPIFEQAIQFVSLMNHE